MVRLSKIQRQLASLIERSAYCYVNDDRVVLVFINPKGDRKELEFRLDRDQALALGLNLIAAATEQESSPQGRRPA
jgi:hypothetical protein